ncbi:hypothetical protein FPZ22_07320 [Luteimonas granuli]|uniref:CENP-V/GFA domain-containing protein n=1 Tax=Luteimonas granuli TaxID=1176533 RepID=A0A518N4C5_9GAMM|nr:hypothetical protein FPZ22_07320 [Luteimonas granuli]
MLKEIGGVPVLAKHRATCHCGSVELELDLPQGIVDPRRCDCSICRRKGAVVASVSLSGIRIVKGSEHLKLYEFNTRTAKHYFCGNCGIYTHHQRRSNPDQYGFNAGHDVRGPNRTELRRAFNTITSAHERWFCYVFDESSSALPLEGKTGSGDSGGPALVQINDQWVLVGLSAWGFIHGDVRATRPGLYGQLTCNVRLSHYIEWIQGVISEPLGA